MTLSDDPPSEWRCPRCGYPNTGSSCRDCGYNYREPLYGYARAADGGLYPYGHSSSQCTCNCPVHGREEPKRERRVKEKPLTKKEKADLKAFLKDLNKKLSGKTLPSVLFPETPKPKKTTAKKKPKKSSRRKK